MFIPDSLIDTILITASCSPSGHKSKKKCIEKTTNPTVFEMESSILLITY